MVEAKRGTSGFDIGTVVFNYDMNFPSLRPDLQIETSRDIGSGSGLGSQAVCDVGPPPAPIGGVPHIGPPPSFAMTPAISNALNDFGCRFVSHTSPLDACTGDGAGASFFANTKESQVQFCAAIDTTLSFPSGKDTLITVQVLDAPPGAPPGTGVSGGTKSIVIRAP